MYTYRNPSTRPNAELFTNQPWRPRKGYFLRWRCGFGRVTGDGFMSALQIASRQSLFGEFEPVWARVWTILARFVRHFLIAPSTGLAGSIPALGIRPVILWRESGLVKVW